MGTLTSNLKLYKPAVGEAGYGNSVNANFDQLDALLAKAGPNLRHLLFPSNHADLIAGGWEPYWFNQQWGGGPILGGVDGDDTLDYPTGHIEDNSALNTVANAASTTYRANGFKVSQAATLAAVWVKVYKVGNPTNNLRLRILPDDGSGTKPTGNTPVTNGTATEISGKQFSSNTAGEWVRFSFPIPPLLTANTAYHIVLSSSGAVDAANYWIWKSATSKKYPLGNLSSGDATPTWTATTTECHCFLVETAASGRLLQSGGQFARKLVFFEGGPLNQSGALRTSNDHFFDESGFSFHQTFSSLTNSKTFLDCSLGALDHDRVLLRVETNVVVLRVYESDGTVHTVTGTTNVTGAGPWNIGVAVRAKNDGSDYVRLYCNGVSEGTPITAASIALARELRQQGHTSVGGGFGVTPTWTHSIDFSQLPSHASNGWTYSGAATEGNVFSVAGGKLYQIGNGYGATQDGYYSKATTLSNTNGWAVQWRARVAKEPNSPLTPVVAVQVLDGTKQLAVLIKEYYVQASSAGSSDGIVQIDMKSTEREFLLVGKGSDYYLYIDGELAVDGTGKLTATTATNAIRIGDQTPTSGENADAVWSELKYYSTAALLPEFTSGSLHEWSCWSGDQAALFPLLYNSGAFISAKELCGVKGNIITRLEQVIKRQGITSGPTTVATSPADVPDMQAFVYGDRFACLAEGSAANSTVGASTSLAIAVDGSVASEIDESRIEQPSGSGGYALPIVVSRSLATFSGLHALSAKWFVGSGTGTFHGRKRRLNVEVK